MLKELVEAAKELDLMGLSKEADVLDSIIKKLASGGEQQPIIISNDLKIPVELKWQSFSRYLQMKPGDGIGTKYGEPILVKWKDSSSGVENNITIDWNKISSAPKVSDAVNLSGLSDKFSGLAYKDTFFDKSLWGKKLSGKDGYTYVVGRDGRRLDYSRDGKTFKKLDKFYQKWDEVVSNIHKMYLGKV
jgi:hypothetical protein